MKKQILTIVLAITTLTAFAQVPSYVPTSGLVGYWPFNGNANDASGNGNNGTANGSTLTTDRNGNLNSAYYFSSIGCEPRIDVNINTSSVQTGLTISIWMNKIGEGCFGPRLFEFYPGFEGPGMARSWEAPNSSIGIGSITSTGFVADAIIPESASGVWSHIVYTNDGSFAKFFKDGALYNSFAVTGDPILSGNASFGRMNHPSNDAYNGNLDDIGIWNRALTQQEITALFNGCSNPTASIINPQSTTTFCQGGSVVLNASTGTGYTYEWYKNGNIINGSITSSYTANQSGSYTVKVINGSCNATSSATAVTVNPNPTVSLSLANFIHIKESPVTLAGSPSGGTYSGVGVVGSTFSSTNAGLGKKTITYNYTTGAGCSGSATAITTVYDTTACSTFDTLFINIAVAGLIAPNNLGTLKIWPNPANDRITIDNGNYGILSGYSVKIETVLGQEVFKSAINQQQFSVDLTTWNGKGVYLVHILDNQNNIIETKKIVLQ